MFIKTGLVCTAGQFGEAEILLSEIQSLNYKGSNFQSNGDNSIIETTKKEVKKHQHQHR